MLDILKSYYDDEIDVHYVHFHLITHSCHIFTLSCNRPELYSQQQYCPPRAKFKKRESQKNQKFEKGQNLKVMLQSNISIMLVIT